jgi:hypothetical protein
VPRELDTRQARSDTLVLMSWTTTTIPMFVAALFLGGCSFSGSIGKSNGKPPASRSSSKRSNPDSSKPAKQGTTEPRSSKTASKPADDGPPTEDQALAAKAAPGGQEDAESPGQGKERRCENAGKKEGHDKQKAKGEAKGHDMCDD